MSAIITVIHTNGVVISTYDNGDPCPDYTGELPILHNIFKDIDNKENKLKSAKFYISDDPLSENNIEIKSSNIKHWLRFIYDYSKSITVKDVIKDLTPNTNFDNESIKV